MECNLDFHAQDELGAFAILAACTIQTKPTRRESVCSLIINLCRRCVFEKRNLLTAPANSTYKDSSKNQEKFDSIFNIRTVFRDFKHILSIDSTLLFSNEHSNDGLLK